MSVLDERYRRGGPTVENRDGSGHDCISEMKLAAHRPDVLYNELKEQAPQLHKGRFVDCSSSGGPLWRPYWAHTTWESLQFKLWDAGLYATVQSARYENYGKLDVDVIVNDHSTAIIAARELRLDKRVATIRIYTREMS